MLRRKINYNRMNFSMKYTIGRKVENEKEQRSRATNRKENKFDKYKSKYIDDHFEYQCSNAVVLNLFGIRKECPIKI